MSRSSAPRTPITDRPVRWGIVATGGVAAQFVADLRLLDDARAVAVASREQSRAQAFAAAHAVDRAYGSYRELLDDESVDVVYVATPHRQHHAVATAALRAGKPVVVEKAFTVTLAGARDVVGLARRRGVFCLEAMWTRFIPLVRTVRALVADGAVGEPRSVRADLGLVRPFDPSYRMWDPAKGGGSLLELGVYPVSFAQMVLGTPSAVSVAGTLAPNGVDAEAALQLSGFDGGDRRGFAQVACSLLSPLPGAATVFGTEGRIEVEPRFHHPHRIVLHREGRDPQPFDRPPLGRGYTHQIREVARCLRAGRTESAQMPLDDTLAVMGTLERAVQALGIVYTEDDSVEV